MLTLTNPQKRYLKALAHHRKPIVTLGVRGLTPAVIHEILLALDHHELIKIRISTENREMREAIIREICETAEAVLIQRIGHIATLFRSNPEAPRIEWPLSQPSAVP